MTVSAGTPIELVNGVYGRLAERVALGRKRLGRPLTLTEKILINHLSAPESQEMERGRLLEPEVDDPSLTLHATLRQLFLDRAEPTER
ncbi:MAG: aconitase, partial [Actinomycetota bacterium]